MHFPLEAQTLILQYADKVGYEIVPSTEALGRIAYEKVYSNRKLPPKDNSAMDGYVIRWEDYNNGIREFRVNGVIKAGDDVSGYHVGKGECYKIMTGGFIPSGGDSVAEIEITNEGSYKVHIDGKMKYGNHIRKAGEDVDVGDEIDIEGKEITPFILSRLLSAGITYIKVSRRLRVGIFSTGGELTFPTDAAYPEKTIDSNGFFARGFLKNFGVDVEYLGIFKDDNEDLKNFLKRIDKKYDIIVSSAGISSGDYDVVGNVSEELGVKWLIRGIKQKPGKPFSFGFINELPFFALPGNPVSSAFCVFFYLVPFIKKMYGVKDVLPKSVDAYLKGRMKKRNDRVHFNRVLLRYEDGRFVAYPFDNQDSHLIASIAESNGFCMIPSEMVGEIEEGVLLKVYPYDFKTII
ncbi:MULTISPECIES: molybdopterin molybdotransferase MoeA [Calditerrivibrio]|uniref:molybdopterin molybdotransferase MoeA n=1 Tax=Calditerrivibrio TaxID=545865 RepID=UPI003C70D2C2